MHLIIQLFFRLLGVAVIPLGWKLLKGLGFIGVTYTGVHLLMEQARDYVFTQLMAMPTEWLQMIGLLKLDVCINILFSAYIARAVLWGMDKATGTKSAIRWGGKL